MRTLFFLCSAALAMAPAKAQIVDRTFGSQGKATVVFDAGAAKTDEALGVFELDDGRYLTVGQVDVDSASGSEGIGLARLLANGALDPTFDGDGRRVKDAGLTEVLGANLADTFSSPDILVAGAAGADSAVVRFNFDGSDDTGFAGDGSVAWDASQGGRADKATHVLGLNSGDRFVAGIYDSDATAVTDADVYVARIDNSGALTYFARDELGGTGANNDRIVGMLERPNPFAGNSVVPAISVLADNNTPDFVGTFTVFARSGGARLASLRLEAPLPLMRGCNPAYHDFHSAALARVTDRFQIIVGDLQTSSATPKQTFAVVIDVVDVAVEALVCGPERSTTETVAGAAVTRFVEQFGDLHIAMTRDARIGYWRWRQTFVPGTNALIYLPDPTYNGGEPFSVEFSSASGTPPLATATGVTVRDGDPVVVGSRLWRFDQAVIDFDYALFRPIDDVLFGSGFEK